MAESKTDQSETMPDLGVTATVFVDDETHAPMRLHGLEEGLRRINVRPAEPHTDDDEAEPLVDTISIVSHWTLHVALYALQNPTPENVRQALYMVGISGDCEEHIDPDTLTPLPVQEPPGWDKPLYQPGNVRHG